MKKRLVFLGMSAAVTIAGMLNMKQAVGAEIDNTYLCNKIGNVAFTVMIGRQHGVSKELFMDNPETTKYAAGVINRAWEIPVNPEPVEKAFIARDFETDEVKRCLRYRSI